MFLNIVFSLIFPWDDNLLFDASFIFVAIALISLLVYIIPYILTGSYFGIRNKWNGTAVISGVIAIIDLISEFLQTSKSLKTDRMITMENTITLMIGILFAMVTVSIIVSVIIERKEQE